MSVKVLNLDKVEAVKVLGGSIKRMFNPETVGAKNMTFSVGYFSPGEGLKSHIHPESEEVYYIIRGDGKVFLGEEEEAMAIKPDMAIYIPPGTVHGVHNTGDDRLVICFFVAPGKEKAVVL